ncbi:phosphopantetheine-binding protein, partial [Flavobacterium nitrogenifigens]
EEKLASIWQEVLGIERIGVTDNFFELGGNSLSVTRLMNLIYKEIDVKITFNDIFKNMVLESQAALIENIQMTYEVNLDNETTENFIF